MRGARYEHLPTGILHSLAGADSWIISVFAGRLPPTHLIFARFPTIGPYCAV